MRVESHSSIKRFQRCAKAYYYNYVERIEPLDRPKYLERGTLLHELLEAYHTRTHINPDDYNTADLELIERYNDHYEGTPAWEVVASEVELEVKIGPYTVRAIVDLIVRINGVLWVVDHKTTQSIPDSWDPYNMSDWQNMLYIMAVRANYDEPVGGFIFNYLRTKTPTRPKLRKDGFISDLNRVDTTYEILYKFAKDRDLLDDPRVQQRLVVLWNRRNVWFDRHILPVNQAALDEAYRDILRVLTDIERKRSAGQYSDFPRHVVGSFAGRASCGRCDFQSICHADMFDLDRETILSIDYKEKG